ncbi:hypothetical protein HY623_00065 [Candidatus Uhrbacteria bacterium]|nr:hypothetical protein [Candidatus Uhrbacteria bacterium]
MNRAKMFRSLDRFLISEIHHWGIPILRVALVVVFFWFGALKILGATPVVNLFAETYSFFPTESFLLILGWWEVIIGAGLVIYGYEIKRHAS